MTMNYEQWKRMLSAVDKEEGLSKDNVIEKIKEKLKAENGEDEYKKWEEAGFDVNHPLEDDEFTLLHLAARSGHIDVIKELLKVEKITVNAKNDFGITPLFLAAGYGHIGVVEVLLNNGASVNAADENGLTPLHYAASCSKASSALNRSFENNYKHVIEALLKKGVDLFLKNNSGKTPRDLARTGNIKELLEKAEEEQLKKLNEEKNKLLQNNTEDDNKDTTPLLEETEKKQPTSAIKKGLFASGAVAVLGTAVAVALFATGTVAVELISIVIAVAAIAAAALAVGGITYMMLKPSTEMDEVEEEQGITGDERKA